MPKPVKGAGPIIRTDAYPRADYWNRIEMMGTRMAFSQEKYGDLEKNYPEPKSAMATAMQRIGMYYETGNTEHLLDAANMLVIESIFPSHDEAYFTAEGSEASPGLVAKTEEKTWVQGFKS
jgi:hypothetical protein